MRTADPRTLVPRAALAAACLIALGALPLAALERTETITRTFTLAEVERHRTLVVENLSGAIEIEAVGGDAVELTLTQTFVARKEEDLARARREVTLQVTEEPGRLELIQDGPWRCKERSRNRQGGCCCEDDSSDDRRYDVRFDWKLRVPRSLDLEVSSVNEGAIRIAGVAGRLEVFHVNDDVRLERVGGVVDAKTVNGGLEIDFAALPAGDCDFSTVNGDIDLAFPKGLGAELSFATMNGEVYTDFPFEAGKLRPTSARSQAGGRRHFEVGGKSAATIGGGGIGLACRTINGDITIRERS